MPPVTALLYCYRLPNLTPHEFRDYCEQKHVPLVKSLLGPNHPLTHTRYYTNKDSGYAMGSPSSEDPDLIAVITFESEEAAQESMRVRGSDGVREKIEGDEQKFMDRSRVKLQMVGSDDIGLSRRDG